MPLDSSSGLRQGSRVAIVDDDEAFREEMADPVYTLKFEPVKIEEKLPATLDAIAQFFRERAEALLCDHHLKHRADYSRLNGAPMVAQCYAQRFPAVLCTQRSEASREEIQRHRRWIPVILGREDLVDPDSIRRGLEICADEHHGVFLRERRPWRALIKVQNFTLLHEDDEVEISDRAAAYSQIRYIYFSVNGWHRKVVKLPFHDIPEDVRKPYWEGSRRYLHAEVNLGAESMQDLFFDRWEPE